MFTFNKLRVTRFVKILPMFVVIKMFIYNCDITKTSPRLMLCDLVWKISFPCSNFSVKPPSGFVVFLNNDHTSRYYRSIVVIITSSCVTRCRCEARKWPPLYDDRAMTRDPMIISSQFIAIAYCTATRRNRRVVVRTFCSVVRGRSRPV